MSPLRFSLVLHIHQPVGNFDHVFRDHVDDVYEPFFDFLDERELWPIGLHVSGPLFEWFGDHAPAFHDRIGRLADEGRVELLSAGWYEPILAALPRPDRATQLAWTREELERRFGVTPTGLWLTERAWEPDLPSDLAAEGIEYLLLDDHLMARADVPAALMDGPLRTESGGSEVDILTIDERLRYLIPFRPAEEVDAELRARHAAGRQLALLGDDGEKFGGWPRTREWLYDQGWLESFGEVMDRLREEEIVRLVTPAQARAEIPANGPVYVPTGSYPEMEEWAPGGHWKGFLGHYDEANRMHRRVTALSEMCRSRGDPEAVRRAVGRAQCNDAYWHGVFGGLYMKHLREGVRRQAIEAERLLRSGEALGVTATDVDGSGRQAWWAHGAAVSAWIDTRFGGTISDLLWLDPRVDVVDVLTRRREVYHEEALARDSAATDGDGKGAPASDAPSAAHSDSHTGPSADSGAESGTASIHDIEEAAVLDRLPPEDRDVRTLIRDRVLASETSFEAYRDAEYEPVWEAGQAVAADPVLDGGTPGAHTLTWRFETQVGPSVAKVLTLSEDGSVGVTWTWDPADFPEDALFAPEISLGADLSPDFDPAPEVWSYPIITVSKCPDGFEEITQGISVTPRWPTTLGTASMHVTPPAS